MKKLVLLLSIVFISCDKNIEKLNSEIESLKQKNDSLLKITNALEDKFVFDEARIKVVPSEKNSNKLGSKYEGTFVIEAYNKSDEVLFSNNLDDSNELVNPQALKNDDGVYPFEFKLTPKENRVYFIIKNSNSIGKSFDGIIISDKAD